MYSAVITKSGQVTLPKELRDFLGVKPGEKIIFDTDEKRVIIKRKFTLEEYTEMMDKNMSKKTKRLAKKYANMTVSEMREAYAKSRRGRAEIRRQYGI